MRNWVDLDGNIVLQTLNDNSGLTYQELEELLDIANKPGAPSMALYNCLITLNGAGLIRVDDIISENFENFMMEVYTPENRNRKIRVSNLWWKIKMAIDMKYCGSKKFNNNSLTVYPLFGRPDNDYTKSDIFVLMPFNSKFLPIYKEHINNVASSLNLTVRRADDFFTNNQIITDIWSAICGAAVIIADCTGRNPNVFYELGITHTIGKPAILITQDSEDVPVDVKHIKYIKYEYTPPGMRIFEETLSNTLRTVLELY